MKVSKTGYKKTSKDKYEESLLIPTNEITMENVQFPVLGISDTGDVRIMNPGEEHVFNGNYVIEKPMKKEGGHIVPGRYRNPEGNWLNKYAGGGDISIPDLSRPNWLSKYQGDEGPSQVSKSLVDPETGVVTNINTTDEPPFQWTPLEDQYGIKPSAQKRSDYVPYKDVSGSPYETQDPYIGNYSTVDVPENLSELPSYRLYAMAKGSPKPFSPDWTTGLNLNDAGYVKFDEKTGYNYQPSRQNLQDFQSLPMEGEKEFNLRRFVLNPYEGQPQTHDAYVKKDGTVDKENFIPTSYSREETMDNVFKDLYAQNLYKFKGDRDAAYTATSDFMKERVEPQYRGKYYEYMNNPNVSERDKLNINLVGSHMTVNPIQTEDYVRQGIADKLAEEHPEYMERDEAGNYKMSDEDFSNLVKADPRYKKKLNEYNDVLQDWYVTNKNMSPEEAKALVEKDLYKNVPKRKTTYFTFKNGGSLEKYPRGGEYVSTNPEMLDLQQLGNTKYKIGLDTDKNFYVDLGNGTQFKFNQDLSNKIVTGFSDLMPGYDPYLGSLNKTLSSGLPSFARPVVNSIVHSQEKKLLADIDAQEQKQKAELEQKLLEERKRKGIEGKEFVKKLLGLDLNSINRSMEDRKASKYSVSDEYQLAPYKDSKTANEVYEKTPDYKIRYLKDTSYGEDDIKNVQDHLVRKGYLEPQEQINPGDYKTKDQIIALQKKLFKAGLGDVMGKEGPYQDGVTGVISNNTLKAINKYNESQKSFNIGELDDKTKAALKKYRNITDAQNVLDIEIADPNSLVDPETGIADVEKSTLELNLFENALTKKGYFQGRTDYDFTSDPLSPTKPKYKFTVNPQNETKFVYCMEYANSEICREDAFGDEAREELGLNGDAWHVSENIIDKGGSLVFAGLPDRSSVNLNSKNDIAQYLKSTLTSSETLNGLKDLVGSGNIYDDNPYTKPKLQPGDVVNIFYEGSDFTEQAYKQTKNLNNRFFTTHVGVVKVGDNGDLYIEHNIHHSINKDKPQDFINGKIKGNGSKRVSLIAGITRPNYAAAPSNIQSLGTQGLSYYDNNIAGLNPKGFGANPAGWNTAGNNEYGIIGNENTAKYINIIEKNKDKLLQDIPITENEYVKLARIARTIPAAETSAKDDYETRYTRTKDGTTYPLWMVNLFNDDETSMGFTRLKDETNLNAGIREKLYGDDDSQLDEPTKAALPTFYLLSKNYLYLKEVANKYKVKATTDELVKLAGLGYNQSIGRIAKEFVDKGSYDNYINYRKETAASGDGRYHYSNTLNAYDLQTKKYGGPTKWLDRYQDGREVAADATAVKVNPLVRAINIDKVPSNFDYQNYYDKADKYLSRDIFKGTTLTAKDIADAANEFYIESNYQYPLDLLLTQAQIESKLGKALKSKHNYFNVGNTDSGATRDFPSAKDSVKDYMTLMYNNYLNKGQKNVKELLKPKGFVNYEGSRYASNPDYENMLSSQMQFINNYLKGYKKGGWLNRYQGVNEASQYERRDPNQLMYPTPGEEDTYTSQYSLPAVEITPNWTEAELERNKLRDKYIADDKKAFRHWYDKLGYDKDNVTKRANQFAYNKLAKQYLKGDKDNLSAEQRKFIEKSEYANRLQPSIGARFVEGVTNPGFNLETLGNLAAPFEYPSNLVRGAVQGELGDAFAGKTTSPYFVSSDLAGTSPTEAAIASGALTALTDPFLYYTPEGAEIIADYATKRTPLKYAYKLNKNARGSFFKPLDKNKNYRYVNQAGYDDARKTFTVQANPLGDVSGRPTEFASFSKGKPSKHFKATDDTPHYLMETDVPMYARGEENPVTGFPIKGRHGAARAIDPVTGENLRSLPIEDINVIYSADPHWWRGLESVWQSPKTIKNLSDVRLGQNIAETGAFNRGVYELSDYPDYLLKYDNTPLSKQQIAQDFDNLNFEVLHKDINSPNVGKVVRQFSNVSHPDKMYAGELMNAYLMRKMQGKSLSKLSVDDLEKIPASSWIQYLKDTNTLADKDAAIDILGENVLYNPKTKEFKFIDISPSARPANQEFWNNTVIDNINSKLDPGILKTRLRNHALSHFDKKLNNIANKVQHEFHKDKGLSNALSPDELDDIKRIVNDVTLSTRLRRQALERLLKKSGYKHGGSTKWLNKYQDGSQVPQSWKDKYDWTPNVEEEYQMFKNDPNAPENLRFTDDIKDYNTRGMWDSLDRPSNWQQALDLFRQQQGYDWIPEDDGYYHAWSQHPGTGEWLKPKHHSTGWMNYIGYAFDPNTTAVVNPEGFFGNETLQAYPRKKKGGVTSQGMGYFDYINGYRGVSS